MLAVVKKPHIEISISGEGSKQALDWLKRKFKLVILADESETADSVNIEDTDFWTAMNENRIGNLLAGARLKNGLSQKELAEKIGIKQNMVSDYETGKRRLTKTMAARFASVLHIKKERLL